VLPNDALWRCFQAAVDADADGGKPWERISVFLQISRRFAAGLLQETNFDIHMKLGSKALHLHATKGGVDQVRVAEWFMRLADRHAFCIAVDGLACGESQLAALARAQRAGHARVTGLALSGYRGGASALVPVVQAACNTLRRVVVRDAHRSLALPPRHETAPAWPRLPNLAHLDVAMHAHDSNKRRVWAEWIPNLLHARCSEKVFRLHCSDAAEWNDEMDTYVPEEGEGLLVVVHATCVSDSALGWMTTCAKRLEVHFGDAARERGADFSFFDCPVIDNVYATVDRIMTEVENGTCLLESVRFVIKNRVYAHPDLHEPPDLADVVARAPENVVLEHDACEWVPPRSYDSLQDRDSDEVEARMAR
jgi:hypothetical protein